MPLPARALSVLNEYQVATLHAAIDADDAVSFLVRRLESRHPEDEALQQALVDEIIIPFNSAKLKSHSDDIIASGHFMVMAVGGGESSLPFAYTVGLAKLTGKELLCIAPFNSQMLGSLVNEAGDLLKAQGDLTTLPEDFITLTDDRAGRTRIDRYPLTRALDMYCCKVPEYVEVQPEHEVLVIRLPDPENRLPGEPGYDAVQMPQPEL